MISIGLFCFAVIPVVILASLLVWSRRRDDRLRTLIIGATLVHEFLLICLPTVYSIFTDFELERRMVAVIRPVDLLAVMIGESVFILMFAIGLVIALPGLRTARAELGRPLTRAGAQTERILLNALILIGCLVYAPKMFSLVSSVGSGVTEALATQLEGVFYFMPLVVCAFLVTTKGELRRHPVRTLAAAIPLISLVVVGLMSGARGRIIWAISLLLIAGIYNRQKKVVVGSVLVAVLLLPVFAVLGDRDTRGSLSSATSQAEILTLVYEAGVKNMSNSGDMVDAVMESFFWRAQGVRNSVVLYQDAERGGGSFNTYMGAVFAFVPRSLWPDKPMLGSLDNTESEAAMYKVMLWGHNEPGTMGPLLASSHAYWEGGALWLICAGLITGLFWNAVFRACRRLPILLGAVVSLTFAAAFLIDGLLTMLVPLYAFIIRMWLSVLPLTLMYITVRSIWLARPQRPLDEPVLTTVDG